VHSTKVIRQYDALTAVRELFHFCFWHTRTCARGTKPTDGPAFDPNLLPRTSPVPPQTPAQLQTLAARLADKDTKLAALQSDKAVLDEALQRLHEEVAQVRAANAATPDHTTTPRPRPAITSSTCCSRKPAGPWTTPRTVSSRSAACPTSRVRASWTTCCGAMTVSRWR
jgi:hypothetical protein